MSTTRLNLQVLKTFCVTVIKLI